MLRVLTRDKNAYCVYILSSLYPLVITGNYYLGKILHIQM